VTATELGSFDFASRTAKRYRTEIRAYTGFREYSVADAEALPGWLAEHVASGERRPERVREELILRCRAELIEPPTPERVRLEFRSNNTAHQPIIDALALIVRYAHSTAKYYPLGEHVVLDGAVDPVWADLLASVDSRGRTRVIRHVYEACVFQALRERLRCREIWVLGAHEWRNPDEDLPTDFETRRAEHYDKLHKPLDPAAFTAQLRQRCAPSSPR
jgi:hypothetical protein